MDINCTSGNTPCNNSACLPGTLFWPTVGILSVNLVIAAVQLVMTLCKMRRKVRVRSQRARWRFGKQSVEVHTICDGAVQVKNARAQEHESIWVDYIKSLDKAEDKMETSNSPMESVIVTEDESFESFEMVKSEDTLGVSLERIFDQHISAGEENLAYCTNDEINTNSTV